MTSRGTTRAPDSRAMLRAAMLGYPRDLEPRVVAFLATLPWRWHVAVELVYGRGLTQEQAARELCVSRWTVGRDLRQAARRWREEGER